MATAAVFSSLLLFLPYFHLLFSWGGCEWSCHVKCSLSFPVCNCSHFAKRCLRKQSKLLLADAFALSVHKKSYDSFVSIIHNNLYQNLCLQRCCASSSSVSRGFENAISFSQVNIFWSTVLIAVFTSFFHALPSLFDGVCVTTCSSRSHPILLKSPSVFSTAKEKWCSHIERRTSWVRVYFIGAVWQNFKI